MGEYIHRIDDGERARIRSFLRITVITTIAFVVLVVGGIATAPQWVRLIGHDSEHQFAEPHIKWISEHVLDSSEPALQAYVARLGASIADSMEVPQGLQLQFHVIDGDSVNAFTTLGGHIFVIDELIAVLDNENALAMVLAHEIAHAINRDPLTSVGRGVLLQLLISTLSGSTVDPSTSAGFGAELALNAYSRKQEEAADAMALQALLRHYGHVGGGTQLFEALRDTESEEQLPAFLLSHPHLAERVAAIEQRTQQGGWRNGEVTPYPADVLAVLSSTP